MEKDRNKCHEIKKEGNTMAAITKPTERAFVLSSQKADAFLKQDNSQFRNIMAKFKKYTKKGHSISKKS